MLGLKLLMAKKTSASKKGATKKTAVKKTAAAKKAAAPKKAKAPKKEAKPKKPVKAAVKKIPVVKDPALILVNTIVNGMQEKKAKHITILDLRKLQNRVSDFFVICDADSNTHVDSIAGSIDEEVRKKLNERPFHSEGWENGQWILMDYVNVVAHVFLGETREFYNMEGLWADGEITTVE